MEVIRQGCVLVAEASIVVRVYNIAMHITSHFIGISLDSSKFTDLFVDLQQYFRSHDLEGAIEFQNILSLHITLYYLESSLTEDEKTQPLQDASDMSSDKMLGIAGLKGSYFGEPGKERVCYVGCAENERLKELNQLLAKKYEYSQIPENQLAFVPHISLFRINNPEAYTPHKAKIDTVINRALRTIDENSLIQGVRLYQVCSLFRPEVQIAI